MPFSGASKSGRKLESIGTGPYATLVLAEWEDEMWLATVCFDQPPEPGLRFRFRGMLWELTWARDAGCGARPVLQ
jgi:hypothetical protein